MLKKLKTSRNAVILIGSLLLFAGFRAADGLFEITRNIEIFVGVYKEVNSHYVDEPKPGELMKKGIDAMLASLDPYTNFYTESQAEDALMKRTGEYGGIGCQTVVRDRKHMVTDVFQGSPAAESGLRVGDYIMEINGKSFVGRPAEEAYDAMAGAANGIIHLKIERLGRSENIDLVRKEIKLKNVPYYGMIDASTGYVKLDQFMNNCSQEIKSAILDLRKNAGFKQLVLDLRDNPGGLLTEAVSIVGLFVPRGTLVVSTKGREGGLNQDFRSVDPPDFPDLPLAILINSHSASASEIVSGALQDLDRAVVVGRNSYGKGLVQNTYSLPYRTAMKITTAKYYIPSGRCIQLLDYSHRNADGSAGRLPDSLRRSFKTSGSRIVYDGGGVRPDREIDELKAGKLMQKMVDQYLLFDYATYYRDRHDSLDKGKSFVAGESEFREFLAFLSDKADLFATETERSFDNFRKSAEAEDMKELSEGMEEIRSRIRKRKIAEVERNKAEVLRLLSSEILRRYYFTSAITEHSFGTDPDIREAMQVLRPETYQKILKGI